MKADDDRLNEKQMKLLTHDPANCAAVSHLTMG